jgi:MoaA/NifB/PqqE/SkfB family radical SAM enzyme
MSNLTVTREKELQLPASVCFRVTRLCNARCGFCLAPPTGDHPDGQTLADRIDWLLERGVRTIHFCGGEPTIHPALPELLMHVRDMGGKSKLTTNGIAVSAALPAVLRASATEVKVSLHGDRAHHDRMVGRVAFDSTTSAIRRLVAAGVRPSIQTTVVTGGTWVVDWVAQFCLETGVRQLRILPFIPRGSGYTRRQEFGLSTQERRALRELVSLRRRDFGARLDVRWLDFTARPIPVIEPDGALIMEGATEAMDVRLAQIPLRRQPDQVASISAMASSKSLGADPMKLLLTTEKASCSPARVLT